MLTQFVRIRNEVLKESLDDHGSIPIDRGAQFFNKVKKRSVMLPKINLVTKIFLTRHRTFSVCRGHIDILLESISRASNRSDARLFHCTLGDEYLRIGSHISTNPAFETGVVQTEQKKAKSLSQQEKRAVKDQLWECSGEIPDDDQETKFSIKEMLHKKRKTDVTENYISSDFILGSTADVEWVWSTAKSIFQMLEAISNILFLRHFFS